nr:integrase, catalytic region, zinc finger, CCHC-type, peptidase aspartic, catalytic [Tanacetum cinerariifolium]
MRRKERATKNVLDAVIQIISLTIVQNDLATKIKRPSLEVLGAIAKMTLKIKLTMKLISCLNRQMREMLNNQKSPSCKIGLGFDSDKASTRETKTMSFVGSSSEKGTDESTIKVHGSTLPGSVCLITCLEPDELIKDSGFSKHMTDNKSLFSTYKAYDGGNVVFGSNLKGKTIGLLEYIPRLDTSKSNNYVLKNTSFKKDHQSSPKCHKIMPPKAMSQAAIERLITQRVNAALEAKRAGRGNEGGRKQR